MRNPKKKSAPSSISRQAQIKKLAADGDGIAHIDGKNWYIPYTQIGDIVDAVAQKQTKDYTKAKAETFIEYSPQRQKPLCPLFGQCGGCKLQHLPKDDYQKWKTEQLLHILSRHHINIDEFDETCFLPAESRRRVTFSINKNNKICFHQYNSHQFIAIENCPILDNKINQILPFIQDWLHQYGSLIPPQTQLHISLLNAIEVTFITKDFMPPALVTPFSELQKLKNLYRLCWKNHNETHVIWQKELLFSHWGELAIPMMPSAFLQASRQGEDFLQRKLIEYTKDAKSAVDLFCGIGTFSFIMAQNGCKTHGYDNAATSVYAAKQALKAFPKLGGYLTFTERDLFRQPLLPHELKYDVIILDPPRAGAKETVMQIAAAAHVKKIVMISCNPKSFARDMEILKKADFHIHRLSLLDQFVYSPHSELICEIVRKS